MPTKVSSSSESFFKINFSQTSRNKIVCKIYCDIKMSFVTRVYKPAVEQSCSLQTNWRGTRARTIRWTEEQSRTTPDDSSFKQIKSDINNPTALHSGSGIHIIADFTRLRVRRLLRTCVQVTWLSLLTMLRNGGKPSWGSERKESVTNFSSLFMIDGYDTSQTWFITNSNKVAFV